MRSVVVFAWGAKIGGITPLDPMNGKMGYNVLSDLIFIFFLAEVDTTITPSPPFFPPQSVDLVTKLSDTTRQSYTLEKKLYVNVLIKNELNC